MRLSSIIYGSVLLLLIIMLPVFLGFSTSCQPAAEAEAVALAESLCNLPAKEIETMNPMENKVIAPDIYGIPPIDAAAPVHTETATFSLG
jgi:hypothetical protein